MAHFRCYMCRYFKGCKRIDHDKVRFAISPFKSYDGDFGTVCSDFLAAEWIRNAEENKINFDEYWKEYIQEHKNLEKKLVYFTLGGNTDIRYGVYLKDYVFGTMIQDNILKAVKKQYYKRTKKGSGYKLIQEDIKGVDLNSGNTL